MSRFRLAIAFVLLAVTMPSQCGLHGEEKNRSPNIVFIFSDDLTPARRSAPTATSASCSRRRTSIASPARACGSIAAWCPTRSAGPAGPRSSPASTPIATASTTTPTAASTARRTTFPKLLQSSRLPTAIVGKWHLISDPTGFDYLAHPAGAGRLLQPADDSQRRDR